MLAGNQHAKLPFFSTIGSIWFATMLQELRDKTFLAVIVLSTSYDNMAVLAGALTSFVFTSLSSTYLGLVEKQYLDEPWTKWVTLASFVLFEIFLLVKYLYEKDEPRPETQTPLLEEQENERLESKWTNSYLTSLLFVTLCEFGDNSMLGIARLNAGSLSPVPILIGALAAFSVSTLLALFLGKNIAHCLTQRQVYGMAAILQFIFAVLHSTLG